jgi:hypothetical protein
MAENSFLVLLGAACGWFAAFFLFVAGKLWLRTVPPVLRRWRYRGVNIAGEWKGLGTGAAPACGEWSEVTLNLKQHSADLHGLMMIRTQAAGRSFDLSLQVAGKVTGGYATLGLTPAGKATGSVATALLKAEGDGALNGQLLYRHPLADTVDVIHLSVHRAESSATPRLHPASRPATGVQPLQAGAPFGLATKS